MGQTAGSDWKSQSFNCGIVAHSFGGNNGLVGRVHHGYGVGTVWQGVCAGSGWTCSAALGETEGRREALASAGVGFHWGAQGRLGMAIALWVAGEGRHKACPYRYGWGDGDRTVGGGGGQAQGLPLQGRLGGWRSHCGWWARAGTRPAPTGACGGILLALHDDGK